MLFEQVAILVGQMPEHPKQAAILGRDASLLDEDGDLLCEEASVLEARGHQLRE